MKYQIKNKFTGRVISESDNSIKDAAEIGRADLRGANLRGADLRGADLGGADLRRADLRGASGVNKYLSTALTFLYDQPGKIRAYKLVTKNRTGPYYPGITYGMNRVYTEDVVDADETSQCGAGINLATLDWCLHNYKAGYRVFIAEFTAKDIVAIPIATDGKFRVRKCKIVGEVDLKKVVPEWFEKNEDDEAE